MAVRNHVCSYIFTLVIQHFAKNIRDQSNGAVGNVMYITKCCAIFIIPPHNSHFEVIGDRSCIKWNLNFVQWAVGNVMYTYITKCLAIFIIPLIILTLRSLEIGVLSSEISILCSQHCVKHCNVSLAFILSSNLPALAHVVIAIRFFRHIWE